jgi:hypothetical protein
MSINATQTCEDDWAPATEGAVTSELNSSTQRVSGNDCDSAALAARLAGVRRAFAVRRADLSTEALRLQTEAQPRPGDVVLAQVTDIGQHPRLELADGRRSHLYPGDEILVAYGHRYAADQFEAEIPESLKACHLVAAGGIASRMLSRHSRIKEPTRIKPLGLLAKADGQVLNVSQWRLDSRPIPSQLPPILIVAGTSMNAGKTTAAASLIKGLQRSGKRVGAAKVTGTGAGGDYWQMTDAGAAAVVDFTDAGHASTYLLAPQEVEQIFLRLIGHLARMELDAIVVEVADGILQAETAELLASPVVSNYCRGVLFAAGDSMGAMSGVQWLQRNGLPVHAVSGALTASPLAVREISTAMGIPVIGKKGLANPGNASALLAACV